MAVVVTGCELFVNSAWTSAKKVPAKSPFGVELEYGVNAFGSLDAAIDYATEAGLTDVQFIVGDKAVAVTDAEGKVAFISAQEIKGSITEASSKSM